MLPWSTVTYSEALQQVRAIAAWILAQGCQRGAAAW